MCSDEALISRVIERVKVSMPGGWHGWVAVRDAQGEQFSKSDWLTLLAEPQLLLDDVQHTIKSDGQNSVVVKELATADKRVKAVIKQHQRAGGVREFFRSFGRPRAIQNFNAAVKTVRLGLPVAAPLAAVYRRTFLFCGRSIYISEYVDGLNLYEFLKNLPSDSKERLRVTSRLSELLAEIFASLHKNGLWHRDAKATNFIVSGNSCENHSVVLTDMDGIKPGFFARRTKQMRTLWQLAASVMKLPTISRTDYLRMFAAYCEKVGLPEAQCADTFRRLARMARAKHKRNCLRRSAYV